MQKTGSSNVIRSNPDRTTVSGQEYNDRNQDLFSRRALARLKLAEAESGGDMRAAERARRAIDTIDTELIELNYGLVWNYVRKFTSTTSQEDSQDFESAALLGLMRAISTYDPARGAKFSTWAYKPIQRECLRAVREADFKQLNPGDFEKRPEILRLARQQEKLHGSEDGEMPPGHTLDYQAIATEARTSVATVKRVLHSSTIETLSRPMGEGGTAELADILEDEGPHVDDTVLHNQELKNLEACILESLESRELFVICRRFGLDGEPAQRLSAIGDILGLSREAVRQIESKALSKMNHPTVRRRLSRHGRR